MINRSLMPQVVLTLMTLAGAGCNSPALVYGERNSLHVASVQVNDNTSEPLRLNVGFRRTIATMASSLQGSAEAGANGDAVSAFSSFNLHSDDGNAATIIDPFVINTKFASGKAARAYIKSASGGANPEYRSWPGESGAAQAKNNGCRVRKKTTRR